MWLQNNPSQTQTWMHVQTHIWTHTHIWTYTQTDTDKHTPLGLAGSGEVDFTGELLATAETSAMHAAVLSLHCTLQQGKWLCIILAWCSSLRYLAILDGPYNCTTCKVKLYIIPFRNNLRMVPPCNTQFMSLQLTWSTLLFVQWLHQWLDDCHDNLIAHLWGIRSRLEGVVSRRVSTSINFITMRHPDWIHSDSNRVIDKMCSNRYKYKSLVTVIF